MLPLPTPEELEESLWRDLLDRWFPACIDPEGGYRQNFDADFRPTGDASKSLVFQSRMVWVCATVAGMRPEFAEYARHGVRFLRDRLLDRRTGAFAWSTEGGAERHAYGLAFAVYGLAAAGRHLGDGEALELAKGACTYLEAYHHDETHGGYFEATTPTGEPILEGGPRGDAIGTPYGQKSQNTHLNIMEAYTELYRAWPDLLVRERLEELLNLFQMGAPSLYVLGSEFASTHLTLFVYRDWTPASSGASYGHDIEAAHLMLDAGDLLYTAPTRMNDDRQGMVFYHAFGLAQKMLTVGWDETEGGIFYAGTSDGPTDRTKNWWAQAEALLGFATLWSHNHLRDHADAVAREWAFIRDRQIDHERGGWYEEAGRPERAKGHTWKAAYHDGRALLFTARILRGGM